MQKSSFQSSKGRKKAIMKSEGKSFEYSFKHSTERQGIWIFRINDTFVKAKEYDSKAFVPQQACDYIIHYGEYVYMLELKTTDKKYITIEVDNAGMIKKHQYTQLLNRQGNKEIGGFILQFQRDTEEQTTYFLDIDSFMKFLQESGKKSINRLDVVQYGGILIEQAKINSSWYYNVKELLGGISC